MLAWTRQQVAARIRKEQPGLSDEQIKWHVALHFYASEPEVVALVQRHLAHKRYGDTEMFSHHIYCIQAKDTSFLPTWFTYLLLRTPVFHELVAGHSNGTTVNMLPKLIGGELRIRDIERIVERGIQ